MRLEGNQLIPEFFFLVCLSSRANMWSGQRTQAVGQRTEQVVTRAVYITVQHGPAGLVHAREGLRTAQPLVPGAAGPARPARPVLRRPVDVDAAGGRRRRQAPG